MWIHLLTLGLIDGAGGEQPRLGGLDITERDRRQIPTVSAPNPRQALEQRNAERLEDIELHGKAKKLVAAAARVQARADRGEIEAEQALQRLAQMRADFAALPQVIGLSVQVAELGALFDAQMQYAALMLRLRDEEETLLLLAATL